MKVLTYVVSRGREKGVVLTPHRGADEKYVASPTRFKKDYVKVERVEDLIPLMQKGYGVRMSNQDSDTTVVQVSSSRKGSKSDRRYKVGGNSTEERQAPCKQIVLSRSSSDTSDQGLQIS
jgi:hypothetical protein